MGLFYISGVIGTVTSLISLFPQLYSAYRTDSLKDVSKFKLVNYAVCAIAWMIHGIGLKSTLLIGSNIVSLLGSLALIFQKVYYEQWK